MLWFHWDGILRGDNRVYLLAAIYGTAAGSASAFAIVVETGGRAVLLIPAEIKRLKRQGRREQRNRMKEAYRRFGVEVDGVVTLPLTPEVEQFLDSESDEPEK